MIIEEIKTTTLSLELVNEEHNRLHWAQAQCYAYMYARQHHLDSICVHLTYYHLDSRKEKRFERIFSIAELESFLRSGDTLFKLDAQDACTASPRDQSIQQLGFPYAVPFRSTRHGGGRTKPSSKWAAVCAITYGVGKTIAALFPAVRRWDGAGNQDLLFDR